MALRLAITVFLGAEGGKKISQYVLEKLLLFFSVSDPVSPRTETRTGGAGEGAAAAARSDPSLLPAETPSRSPWGGSGTGVSPQGSSIRGGARSIWEPGHRMPWGWLSPPSPGQGSVLHALSILGEQHRSPIWLPKPPGTTNLMSLKCQDLDKLLIFLQSAKIPVDQWQNLQ